MTDGEFDQMAAWTVEAIERLGHDHAVPGACRGSGGPGAMEWLATWLLTGRPEPFLDLGGGLAGPCGWLAAHHGVAPILTEPMARAVAGGRRLFGMGSVQADGAALPFATDRFGAGWCLGVLSTAPDRQALMNEAARVIRPGGRVGLVVYTSTQSKPITEPEGNHFPTREELDHGLATAGFTTEASVALDDLPDADPEWNRLADAVDRSIAERHGQSAVWRRAAADEGQVSDLLEHSRVRGWALRLTMS